MPTVAVPAIGTYALLTQEPPRDQADGDRPGRVGVGLGGRWMGGVPPAGTLTGPPLRARTGANARKLLIWAYSPEKRQRFVAIKGVSDPKPGL